MEDRGEAGVFATIEWGGVQMKSKTVKSPLINKQFYFHIPIPSNCRKEESNLIDFMNQELMT